MCELHPDLLDADHQSSPPVGDVDGDQPIRGQVVGTDGHASQQHRQEQAPPGPAAGHHHERSRGRAEQDGQGHPPADAIDPTAGQPGHDGGGHVEHAGQGTELGLPHGELVDEHRSEDTHRVLRQVPGEHRQHESGGQQQLAEGRSGGSVRSYRHGDIPQDGRSRRRMM